jgi:deferrochelatase/peroxidase EfeB
MLRRGLPYGPEFQEGESPYGVTVPDEQDRGLLFVCYQASIARTFEFVQSRWANVADFEQPGDGVDPIATQSENKPFRLPPDKHLTFAPWVITTAGAYFFSPSFSGLRLLAGPEASSPLATDTS